MTDIKSAFSNVFNQWDAHENEIRKQPKEKETMTTKIIAHRFKPTNNASRETFNAVRDFPNQKGVFYIEMLGKKGFKSSTVSTLLYQMARSGNIVKAADGCMVTAGSVYTPIKLTRKGKEIKPNIHALREILNGTDTPSVGIAALKAEPIPAPRKNSIIVSHNWTPQKAIENLTVFQARALYDELKKLFGG